MRGTAEAGYGSAEGPGDGAGGCVPARGSTRKVKAVTGSCAGTSSARRPSAGWCSSWTVSWGSSRAAAWMLNCSGLRPPRLAFTIEEHQVQRICRTRQSQLSPV